MANMVEVYMTEFNVTNKTDVLKCGENGLLNVANMAKYMVNIAVVCVCVCFQQF